MASRRLTDRVLDLDTLEVLARVGDTGSISRAAIELGITQQAVSARIRAVEQRLGIRLVERTAAGSALTDAGSRLRELAAPVLSASQRLEAELPALGGALRPLVVAASQTIAEALLPGWIQALRADSPDVDVRIVAGNSRETADLVRSGRAAIGFIETPDLPGDLLTRQIGADELVLVVAPDHPWAGRSVDAIMLAHTPLLVREVGSGTRSTLESQLGASGLSPVEPAAVLATSGVVRASAIAGVAPAVVSARLVGDDLDAGRLERVAVDGLDLSRPLTAIWATEPLGTAAQKLLGVARATDERHDPRT
ncbi:LysR family transcriptional regulator [Schumannella sp. 10F1B-5-1]|uniref:LysR family transcriptional regulator n=1 Tax=Schumannella sp. 10F1B-5-1 TaxID=2590780 RepID=UPI001C64342C|nr:LysR family transcriptional regulator [Schumannella sp. 10F1B-5-1]